MENMGKNNEKNLFISVRGRVLINVETLNMTERVGNYVKHRRVPVISPDTYATYFVPAISGESLAHGYQRALAEEAVKANLPVCNLCKNGYFLKSANDEVFGKSFGKEPPKSEDEFEKAVIKNCVVEDIGGFLYAPAGGGKSVKRTSNFSVGYMIPVRESLESVVIEPQLHTRYALGTPFVAEGGRAGGQTIYYVELSSAVYTFSFDLDTRYIGRAAFSVMNAGSSVVSDDERKRRISIALDAFSKFVTEMMFGAKKTRFLPVFEWESVVIAVSDDIWTVPSPFTANYIINTLTKLEKISNNIRLFVYLNPIIFENSSTYVKRRTEELLEKKVNELVEARDLKYKSVIQRRYEEAKRKLEEKLEEKNIHCYESFEECIGNAIKTIKEEIANTKSDKKTQEAEGQKS